VRLLQQAIAAAAAAAATATAHLQQQQHPASRVDDNSNAGNGRQQLHLTGEGNTIVVRILLLVKAVTIDREGRHARNSETCRATYKQQWPRRQRHMLVLLRRLIHRLLLRRHPPLPAAPLHDDKSTKNASSCIRCCGWSRKGQYSCEVYSLLSSVGDARPLPF
jgi:hypothetical protein